MGRKLFDNLSGPRTSDHLMPWWQAMSWNGWIMITLAAYFTANVGTGVFIQAVLLFIPSRRSDTIHVIRPDQHPTLFWSLMAMYCAAACVLWAIAIHASMQRRRRQLERLAARQSGELRY